MYPESIAAICHELQTEYVSSAQIVSMQHAGTWTLAECCAGDGARWWLAADRWGNLREIPSVIDWEASQAWNYGMPRQATRDEAIRSVLWHKAERQVDLYGWYDRGYTEVSM